MTLPTLDKTGATAWQFNVNQAMGGTGSYHHDCASILYAIKQSLITFGTSPWVVWGSADGTALGFGNNDGVDRWTYDATYSKFVWSTIAPGHSWIILEQVGLGGAQFCIDLSNSYSYSLTISFSPAGGFGAPGSGGTGTNGTATSKPTAGDEIILLNNTYWGVNTGSNAFYSKGLHIMQSKDGQCTRVILGIVNIGAAMWFFEKAKNPIAAWTAPYFAVVLGSTAMIEQITYSNLNDTANSKTKIGVDTVSMYMTSAWYVSATVGENQNYPDDDTLEWPFSTIGLASFTAPHRGPRKGEVFDLWWGSTAPQLGATFPEDGTKQFAQLGHLIFPWDGTTSPKTA